MKGVLTIHPATREWQNFFEAHRGHLDTRQFNPALPFEPLALDDGILLRQHNPITRAVHLTPLRLH